MNNTSTVLSSEIKVLEDMREEVRKTFEYLAPMVKALSGPNICGICGKVMIDDESLEVFDRYLDTHLWGDHKWADVAKWLYEMYTQQLIAINDILIPMTETLIPLEK